MMDRKMAEKLVNRKLLEKSNCKEPECFDMKRLMEEYYTKHEGNCGKALGGEEPYRRMMADMPYPRKKEYQNIINYLKYKEADRGLNGSSLHLFDCDSWNGSCELSTAIYSILWGLGKQGEKLYRGEEQKQPLSEFPFGSDTMNTVATALNAYVEKVYGWKKCSVKKLYDRLAAGEALTSADCGLRKALEDCFGELAEASGFMGNLVLVPYHFNQKRAVFTKDCWDLSLALLKNVDGKDYEEIRKADILWEKKKFPVYINTMFLWDYLDEKGDILPLWPGNDNLLAIEDIRPDSFMHMDFPAKADWLKQSKAKIVRAIKRRGQFMTAMLEMAIREKEAYKKICEKIFWSEKMYTSYRQVIGAIRGLDVYENPKVKSILDSENMKILETEN